MPRFAFGLILIALASSGVGAQSKPTSTKRIPIAKEPAAAVVARIDTITVYRTDTLVKFLNRVEATDASSSSGVFSDEGSVRIATSDSGFYFVKRDNEDPFGPTTVSIGQRYGTVRRYSVVNSSGQALCSDTIRIATKYEHICVVCDVGSHTFRPDGCRK